MNPELPEQLRVTAEEYRPDTERMWTRVAAGMREDEAVAARPVRGRRRVPHLALATGVAVVLVAGIVFVGYGPDLRESPPAGGETTTSADATPTEEESTEGVEHPKPDPVDEVDWIWSDGSVDPGGNDYWTQSNLTVKTEEDLTALQVELWVVQSEDVEYFDDWVTDETAFGEAEVSEEDGYLVYRWTLQEGEALEAGEYTLAGQFKHTSRSADGDYYVITAEGGSGQAEVVGDFAAED